MRRKVTPTQRTSDQKPMQRSKQIFLGFFFSTDRQMNVSLRNLPLAGTGRVPLPSYSPVRISPDTNNHLVPCACVDGGLCSE